MAFVLAAFLGAIWELFLTKFFLISSYIDVPLMERLFRSHILSRDQFHVLYRPLLATLSTVLIGLICGIPLALVARRHTLASWVVFALTALASSAVLHWIRGPGLFSFADSWSIPESWLYLIGVLLFALPTAAIVNRRPKLQPNQRLERP